MRTDKDRAFNLRKQGKSYKEIHSELGMSVSTLSNWFKGVDFSEEIKHNLTKRAIDKSTIHIQNLNNARGDTLRALYQRAEDEAHEELKTYVHNPLFLYMMAAYWGEGDKATKHHIRLINTDPKMLKMFYIFLLETCNIKEDTISGALFLYEDLNEEKCKEYWMKEVGIKKFHKTQILPSRHKTKKLPYGTCSIVTTNTYFKKKLLLWIDQLPEMVLNMVPLREKIDIKRL